VNELPQGWATATLGDVLATAPVFTDGDWVETKDQDPDGDVRLTQLADVGVGTWRNRSARFMRLERARAMGCTFLEPGDVLVARMPEPLGRACLFPGDPRPCVTAVDVCVIRTDHDVLSPRWLVWALNSPQAHAQVSALQSGTTRKRVSRKNLSTIVLSLPPRSAQERIVAAIEEQFSRLDAADAALRSGARRLAALPTRLIDRSLSGWPTKPLGELIREPLRNGHSAKRSAGGHIPVFTLTAVTVRDFSERHTKLTAADPRRVEDLWAEPGDIFVERSNTPELVGTAALYAGPPRRAIFPDLLIRVRVGPSLIPEFAELALRSTRLRRYFQQRAKGIAGSMPKIDQATILEADLPVPPIEVQARIVDEVERELTLTRELSAAISRASTRSEHLRRGLLSEAFSGRLVPQDPNDEPASDLLARIAAERVAAPKSRRRQRA